ncbi:MAG: tetratricopeptide repeat protein [Bdellovibrionales bacterium]|nr:tetratricopeptide repeat protein [Bdellovibrionales bacterium]
MLRAYYLLFVLLILGCAAREKRDPRLASIHLSIGTGHLNQGLYPQALDELTKALNFDDENPIIHNNLGIAYFVRNRFSEAETHLKKAIYLNPDYTEARNNLGRVLIEMNLLDAAIRELKIADKDLKYESPEKTKSNLGAAFFKLGKFEQAKVYLGESLKLRGQHCLTSNYFARSLFELKMYEQAAVAFDQAINNCKNEELDEPVYYSGLAYFKLKKQKESEIRFEEVVQNYPNGKYSEQASKMLKMIRK